MAWSSPVTVVEPANEPVSLDDAKQFVSIDLAEDEFDVLLGSFIGSARQQVEAMTGTRLAVQTVELQADDWADLLHLPIGPVSAVASIEYDDLEGTEQTVDAAVFELCGAGLERGVRTKVGQEWPSGLRSVEGSIRVRLVVGYEVLPKPVWTAMLLMVSDLFAFRETAVTGTVAQAIPSSMGVQQLLANYRMWL